MNYTNDIQRHIYSIPSLVTSWLPKTIDDCNEILSAIPVSNIQTIVITGCGYSYAAAMAIKDYLTDLICLPICVTPAIETSRFTHTSVVDYSKVLLIAISNSGEVSRINEALQHYRVHGAVTIGITANPCSSMHEHADYLIDCSAPSIGRSLPLRGYAITLQALIGIGYTMSTLRGSLHQDRFNQQMQDLKETMLLMDCQLPSIDEQVQEYLSRHFCLRSYEFVGSGYERAAAFLGKIEMMGQAGLLASDEDCEQWCHCNFFIANPERIGTMLFLAKNSPASSRAREALQYMLHLERPVCLVTDDPDVPTREHLTTITIPPITDYTAGFTEFMVPSLLTGLVCERLGETYSRGFRDQWALFKDGCGTCQSEIVIL